MRYLDYFKQVRFLLTSGLSGDEIEELPRELLSYIGWGWTKCCDPRQIASLIISDFKVPAGDLILEEQRR